MTFQGQSNGPTLGSKTDSGTLRTLEDDMTVSKME